MVTSNPNCFWNMVRQKTKVKDSLGDLVTNNGKILTSTQVKTDCLNEFFSSVFTKENTTSIPVLKKRQFQSTLQYINIDNELVS